MSEKSNDVTATAINDEKLPLGDDEAKLVHADSQPPTDKIDSRVARAGRPNKKRPPKPNKKLRTKADKSRDNGAVLASPPSLRDRLLMSIKLPPIKIDPKCLSADLYDAFKAANLADEQNLPVATFATLTAITAVAGNGITCAIEKPPLGLSMSGGLPLRLAVVAEERMSTLVAPCILGAIYAAESDAFDAYAAEVQQIDRAHRSNAQRHRIREQAAQAGIDLGADIPPSDAIRKKAPPRPRIVIVNGAAAAVRAAAAGGTGVLAVDDRRLPWLANVGNNPDFGTDSLLNTVAAGYPIPVEDGTTGRVNMRSITVGVVGALDLGACDTLYKCDKAQFAGTIFMRSAIPPSNGNPAKLDALLRRVRKLGLEGLTLRLRGDAFASAAEAWTTAARGVQPPLADFLAGAPDLVRRLAVAMHLTVMNGSAASCAIPAKTVANAVRLVDSAVLPVARAILEPCSTPQAERDARRIIGHLRTHFSQVDRVFERRPLLRAWQRTMSAVRLDRALALLVEAELLADMDGGNRVFEVVDAVFGEV